ncbi:hypothetical protein GGF42_003748 [Coemansia sp. RSA 2424]|nr:hypothetical protein GGF42_003748 [Coemansia sp. RSA 2424]
MPTTTTSAKQQGLRGFGKKTLDDFLMLNYRYEVVIGTYVLDFWERMLVNAFLFVILVFVVRTAVSSICARVSDVLGSIG